MNTRAGKVALVPWFTEEGCAHLTELLSEKGYLVLRMKGRSSLFDTECMDHRNPHGSGRQLVLQCGDTTESLGVARIIQGILPDETYKLVVQTHVAVSLDESEHTANVLECDLPYATGD